jgi:hypothetical protein
MNLLSRAWRFCGGSPSRPELFAHDPAAAMPYILENPLRSEGFQERVGKLLAKVRAGRKNRTGRHDP